MQEGCLKKLTYQVQSDGKVVYDLNLNSEKIPINDLLGKKISLTNLNQINCVHCGKKTKKSFSQGHCYPCFRNLAYTDLCQVRPETCHFHLGTCRDDSWAQKNCFIKHTIYLAVSSGLKIGITRAYQEQNRWIDQGASYALPIARVYTRKDSGLIESSLSKYIADKTNWRKMLLGDLPQLDLKNKREEIWNLFPEDVNHEKLHEEEVRTFHYPVIEPPKKIKSFNLDKSPQIEDLLQGVKGQYLIFATGVINIRKYSGYQVALQIH